MNSDLDDISTLNSQNDISSCQYYTFQEILTSFPIIINDDSVNGAVVNSTMHTTDDNIKYENCIKDNFSLLHINSRSINKIDSVDTLLNSLIQVFFFSNWNF